MIRRDSGFTLVEAIVALAVLAVLSGTLLNLFSTALSSSRRAALLASATLLAQSEVALAETGEWRDGVWSGETADGLRWTRTLRGEPEAGPLGRVFEVEVAVAGPGATDPLIRLRTLRLAR
jgi:prepilin-type N-terminal cleavage/methylation domain-containing protein